MVNWTYLSNEVFICPEMVVGPEDGSWLEDNGSSEYIGSDCIV